MGFFVFEEFPTGPLYGLLPGLLILKLVYCSRLRLGDKSSEGQLVIALRTSRTASPFLVLATLLSNLHMVDSHFLTVFEICNSFKDLANYFYLPIRLLPKGN
jgi:hypothetical protein